MHRATCHPDRLPTIEAREEAGIHMHEHSTAQQGIIRSIRFEPCDREVAMLPNDFFNRAHPLLNHVLDRLRQSSVECKIQSIISIRLVQLDSDGQIIRFEDVTISLPASIVDDDFLENTIIRLLAKIEAIVQKGSNWIVDRVHYFDFRVTLYHSAPAYRGHGTKTEMPRCLALKRACINVNNMDGINCFQFAVLSVLHYNDDKINKNHREHATQYEQFIPQYKWRPEHFPMCARNIKFFESDNPGIRVNLLHYDPELENPYRSLYQTKGAIKDGDKLVVLLAYETNEGKSHYVGVPHFQRLFPNHRTVCERCLRPFNGSNGKAADDKLFEAHRLACYSGFQATTVPPEKSYLRFEKWGNMQRLPYTVYADIECMLVKETDGDKGRMAKHVPIAFGFLLVASPDIKKNPLPSRYYQFVGENCMLEGMQKLDQLSREVYQWYKNHKDFPHHLSKIEKAQHAKANQCYMCLTNFDEDVKKVIEHDHITGKYRGAACQKCNSNAKLRKNLLPVFFHNLKNYDAHHLCIGALGQMKEWSYSVIPLTSEKYLAIDTSFPIDRLKFTTKDGQVVDKEVTMHIIFKDSYQFLSASLEKLVSMLEECDFVHSKLLGYPYSFIKSKGVFPYNYFDSTDKLKLTHLPSQASFYDELRQESLSDEDYDRAQNAWVNLGCQTFEDYMLSYLKMDVYQLADIFEKFRTTCLKQDQIDPVYYPTLPSMSWDLAFKSTRAKVDLLSDMEMYDFFDSGIRGGMTFVNKHYLTVNSPRVPDKYNPQACSEDLLYVDANNLYGNALSMKLPLRDFEWVKETVELERLKTELPVLDLEGDTGYVFEVDLEYPQDIHNSTIDFPLAPERMTVIPDMLTTFMKQQWTDVCKMRRTETKSYRGSSKLLLNQYNKLNYIVHGKLLKFYLSMGMKISKIHQAVRFYQSAFFEPYINQNSLLRAASSSDFDKDYFKLKNNALFGKTMENVRRRKNFKLSNSREYSEKLFSRAEFLESYIFSEDLIGILLCKEQIVLNKPIFIGQAVLDLSKLVMYELRYRHLNNYASRFKGVISVAGGDTDSLFLSIRGIDLDTQLLPAMLEDGLLDSSNYPIGHPLHTNRYKAQLGKIKDESAGKAFEEWVLLRPKCYAMKTVGGGAIKRAKGVQRSVVQTEITFEHYKLAFLDFREYSHQQRRFHSSLHKIYTINQLKRTLSFFEDKRAWTSANYSVPYGHYSLGKSRPPKRKIILPTLVDCPPPKSPRIDVD